MKRFAGLCASLIASLLLALAPAVGFAAPPSIDGVFSATVGITGSPGTGSGNITTTSSSGVVEVPICTETTGSTPVAVSSVTSPSLIFTRRSTSTSHQSGGTQTLEIWTAPYSSKLTSAAITVTMASGVDDGLFGAVAVTGLNSTSAPFDTNGSLPATATNSTTDAQPTPPAFSTSQANDLNLAVSCSGSTDAVFDTSSAYTTALSGHGPGPNILFAWMSLLYKAVTATQSSATVPYDSTISTVNVRYVDAMTADGSGGGGATPHLQSMSLLGVQ